MDVLKAVAILAWLAIPLALTYLAIFRLRGRWRLVGLGALGAYVVILMILPAPGGQLTGIDDNGFPSHAHGPLTAD